MKKSKKIKQKYYSVIPLVNLLVLYLGHLFAPDSIVLGNDIIPWWLALVIAAILLGVLVAAAEFIVDQLKLKLKNNLYYLGIYILINIASIWLLARFALKSGFGISSFVVAIVIGIVLALIQYQAHAVLKKT